MQSVYNKATEERPYDCRLELSQVSDMCTTQLGKYKERMDEYDVSLFELLFKTVRKYAHDNLIFL
jgi:hypothetical protein